MACNGETMQPLPAGNVAGTRNTVQPDDSAPSEVHKLANRGSSGSPEGQDEAGASSGESNTEEQGLKNKQAGKGGEMPAPAPKPSGQAKLEAADRKQQEQQRGKEGRAEKNAKLPRPEGIAHCPRCASEDTKFCYYNNYNIKQPRYFCKGCQRYWTAGGTLRNVPVGAGRRKNKNAAAREGDKCGKVGAKAPKEGGFPVPPFGPLMLDPGLAYPPLAPGKGGLPGFVPNLAMVSQLNPLGVPGFQSIVDPAAAAVAAALPARLAAGVDPMQFMAAAAAPCSSQRTSGSAVGEDGSRGGRRVRMRRDSGPLAAHPADSSQHGSASTATEMPGPLGDMHSSRGGGEHQMGSPGDGSAASLSGFQAFPGGPGSNNGAGAYVQTPAMSAPMMQQQDWFSMAAAANQQQRQVQAAAAQQQFQYQAAAMQAQAMQAAAGAWSQGSNPYLSGLCFPYNLYGAGSQWAAAYASLGAQPWAPMDVAGGQGAGNTSGQCAGANSGMAQPNPALLMPHQQGGGNSTSWSNGGSSSWPMAGAGSMGAVNVWPAWPSQSGSMSGGEPQPGGELLQQQHQQQQQQQQLDMSGMGQQHGGMQHGSGPPHGGAAYHGSTLHGAGSSMFSGGGSSGASHLSNLTGLDTLVANGHHHSHSLDTGS